MKNIEPRLIGLFKEGYCTPQISQIAKKLKEPSTTIHYNIKRMEQEGKIKSYKAVFNYSNINEGFCAFILIKLSPDEYGDPERIGKQIAAYPSIESVDVATGDYELIAKAHTKDQDEYYQFIKQIASIKGVIKTFSLISLKQLKNEFVSLH